MEFASYSSGVGRYIFTSKEVILSMSVFIFQRDPNIFKENKRKSKEDV